MIHVTLNNTRKVRTYKSKIAHSMLKKTLCNAIVVSFTNGDLCDFLRA
jgi:hypothetical protein